MKQEQRVKKYVDVLVEWTSIGGKLPRVIKWEDGRKFPVDRILDIRPAASLKAGGCGMRYTILVHGKQSYIYLEEDKWFVEAYPS